MSVNVCETVIEREREREGIRAVEGSIDDDSSMLRAVILEK